MIAAVVLVVVTAAARGTWSPCGLSMISAINPFSERARGNRYGATAAWFMIGSVLGGALLGAVGAVGALAGQFAAPTAAAGAAAACCLITLASDSGVAGFRLPLHPRQVNEQWLERYRRWVYASGFGAQIGTGFATYIMTAAVYLVPALGALSGSPATALGYGLLFGFVRGLAVLLSSTAKTPDKLLSLHRGMDRLEPASLKVAMAAQGVAALTFLHVVGGWPATAVGLAIVLALTTTGVRRAAFIRRLQPQ